MLSDDRFSSIGQAGCDVILEVGSAGDDQARLKAHRIVLSAASPFFYNALNSEMKEKKEGVVLTIERNQQSTDGKSVGVSVYRKC